jgi:uncharacterized protein
MEFKVSELEREPIEFDLGLPPGQVDLGDEAKQVGNLATSGLAEVLHEHRGPKDIVADIRLRGKFAGKFEVLSSRGLDNISLQGFSPKIAISPRNPAKPIIGQSFVLEL